ncbi:transposase [Petroclostridium xylanilyticum]|uniref:transposase n=1 Tax=Petroclostridium xylanilyticum TaxID=1792311 RepID=UPI000B98795A|nr:transposase [Petroclostridium xylanilyticum]
MQRRKFSQEFKEKLIKEALETGNASVVARKYDINPTVVSRWVRDSKKQPQKEIQKKALIPYQNLSQEPTDLDSALKQIQQLKGIIGKKELEIEVLSELLKKTNAL